MESLKPFSRFVSLGSVSVVDGSSKKRVRILRDTGAAQSLILREALPQGFVDRMSRYPEAIPLRSIKSAKIVEALIEFFTRFGMPKLIQSDCGTNFISNYFRDKMAELNITHVTSSPYHPESQGALERFHQTLNSMMKKCCLSHGSEWDRELPYLLFAFRSTPSLSLGFSPFNLVFGHCVRGPLDVVKESWEGDVPHINLLDYVSNLGDKLTKAWKFAGENMLKSQKRMKFFFDRKSKERDFAVGDKVLVLLPIPGYPLKASFSGPWKILKKISPVNYLVETPERRKPFQLCHINMLKAYRERDKVAPMATMGTIGKSANNNNNNFVSFSEVKDNENNCTDEGNWRSNNKGSLANFGSMVSHLNSHKQKFLKRLVNNYKGLFSDVPGRTSVLEHDVDVDNATPVKQAPYRLNPFKSEVVAKEVEDVRKFLGLVVYYRRFVKNFSNIAEPLTRLLKKEVKFVWSSETQNAFEKLKQVLVCFPILRAPDFDVPFALATDASDLGVGAVLFQADEQGVSHPVAIFSKKLTSAQRKYSTVEKETPSLILAINHFSVYLSSTGTPIKIMTDHNPLTFVSRYKNKNQRLMRWSLMLQEWNLEFTHIPGKDNVVADVLSRSVE
ncbi:uncharacterized protein [Macrobrachium rosenbergii]|uniref:uncharacterized protein n=1 Tax=Macrobrachium rosenbergii TaxID=79674 RepID=UPI0034D75080